MLVYQHNKSTLSKFVGCMKQKCTSCSKFMNYSLIFLIWAFNLTTDVMAVNSFKSISAVESQQNQSLDKVIRVVNLNFNLMTCALIFYLAYLLTSAILKLCGRSSSSSYNKNVTRLSVILKKSMHLLYFALLIYWFIFRFDLLLEQGSCSSLIQFCLQMGGLGAAIIIFQSNMSANDTKNIVSQFNMNIIAISCFGHFLSLSATQYYGLMIQHQYSYSVSQK